MPDPWSPERRARMKAEIDKESARAETALARLLEEGKSANPAMLLFGRSLAPHEAKTICGHLLSEVSLGNIAPMRVICMGTSDMNNERHLIVHFAADWNDVTWNGRSAKGAKLMKDSGWQVYGFGKLPNKVIQTALVDGKRAWRARP